jgi:hypothetical protein
MAKKVRNCAIWGPRIHHHPMAASLVNGGGSFCSAATTTPAGELLGGFFVTLENWHEGARR